MPEYLSPGVYIEEVPARLKAIEGVSTSTAGFVGAATRGPVPGLPLPFLPLEDSVQPVLVTSLAEYLRRFGSLPEDPAATDQYLAHSVRAFFGNAGRRCFVCRVVNRDDAGGNNAIRAFVRVGQGTVLGLQQRAREGEQQVVLTSLRNVSAGVSLTFLRRADGSNALTSPAEIVGTVSAPFAMADGDSVGVSVNGAASVNMTPISAQPAEAVLAFAVGPIAIPAAVDLRLRVGADTEPEQTITFQPGDFADATDATLAEFLAVLARDTTGVQVDLNVGANTITLRTDHVGSGARLEIIGGTAIGIAGGGPFDVATGVVVVDGNVADVTRVMTQEIVSLFTPAGFTIAATSDGRLRITSTASGADVTLQVSDIAGAPAAALGLTTALATGSGTATLNVDSYDTQAERVTLSAVLPVDLEPDAIYVLVNGAAPNTDGAMFHARDPGAWGAKLEVSVVPSERTAVGVPAGVANGLDHVQVNSTATFYLGAIVEIDHGTQRSYGVVADILPGNTLRLETALLADLRDDGSIRVIEIDVTLTDRGSGVSETFSRRTWNPDARPEIRERHYSTVINEQSRLVYVQPPGTGTPALAPDGSEASDVQSQPITANGAPVSPLTANAGDNGQPPRDEDVIGTDGGAGARSGIQSLQDIDDIRLIAAPGYTAPAIQTQLISQCERMRYRFAVLDGERDPIGASVVNGVRAHRNLYDTSFAGYYTPWVEITSGERRLLLPPSGYVMGICARVDNQRGVWKAPANEVVQNITGLRAYYSTGEQDILNPRGVNCIRRFEGRGIRVWGARTLSSDPEFRYVNVRRFLIFMEASIDRGTQWVVFEPNSPETWARVVASVTAFLHTQWRDGALLGRRPEDSFFVRCDESTMTVDDIQNGRLICNIGVAIVRPAEFVIFRIEQIAGLGVTS